jgi:hypothetical protein
MGKKFIYFLWEANFRMDFILAVNTLSANINIHICR